jgi:hypothetical protein
LAFFIFSEPFQKIISFFSVTGFSGSAVAKKSPGWWLFLGRHDYQYTGIQHNGTQHNGIQHHRFQNNDTLHDAIHHNDTTYPLLN